MRGPTEPPDPGREEACRAGHKDIALVYGNSTPLGMKTNTAMAQQPHLVRRTTAADDLLGGIRSSAALEREQSASFLANPCAKL
jgi:hypothetical protein